jgi:hypothetical protein
MTNTSDNRRAGPARSLHDAIRRVRTAEAERSDAVVELRDAERARLAMLADELKTVFAEIREDDETFIFSIADGTRPRLWVDMTSFIAMDRDRRTYRFLKDTRLGRTILLETANLNDMADVVTNYVAERIIERERAMEGDWLIRRAGREPTERRPLPALYRLLWSEVQRSATGCQSRASRWASASWSGVTWLATRSRFSFAPS